MADDILRTNDTRAKAPTSDARIIRVPFDESRPGANKSHMPKVKRPPGMTIKHV